MTAGGRHRLHSNWNAATCLRACLESLHRPAPGRQPRTVVVDNASTDGAADMVARGLPRSCSSANAANAASPWPKNRPRRARRPLPLLPQHDTIVPARGRPRWCLRRRQPRRRHDRPAVRCYPNGRLQDLLPRAPTDGRLPLPRNDFCALDRQVPTAPTDATAGGGFDGTAQRPVDVCDGGGRVRRAEHVFRLRPVGRGIPVGGEDLRHVAAGVNALRGCLPAGAWRRLRTTAGGLSSRMKPATLSDVGDRLRPVPAPKARDAAGGCCCSTKLVVDLRRAAALASRLRHTWPGGRTGPGGPRRPRATGHPRLWNSSPRGPFSGGGFGRT